MIAYIRSTSYSVSPKNKHGEVKVTVQTKNKPAVNICVDFMQETLCCVCFGAVDPELCSL